MDDAPAVVTVDTLLHSAFKQKASDIHLEPTEIGLRVRMRCDGYLRDIASVLAEYGHHVVARVKVLARIDIAEKRIPQDGKFIVKGPHGDIDLRVATFPSLYGEKVVIRILDRSHAMLKLEELGFEPEMLTTLTELMQRPHGFFIVTGPTGSGKSTTLYALLLLIKTPEKNIVTLEDPVEYTIEGTTQGQIHPDIGFTFACGLRALLRQDPDIMMVGEIRDTETAQIAVQSALTGHLVLSTLHTNNAPGAVMRLLDMGIEAFLINAVVSGILAQRLVRILCKNCKQETPITAQEAEYVRQRGITITHAFTAPGCSACAQTGYKGRVGIFELLPVTEKLRSVITNHVSYDELYKTAQAEGFKPMIHDAAAKIESGITSISEIMRVIV